MLVIRVRNQNLRGYRKVPIPPLIGNLGWRILVLFNVLLYHAMQTMPGAFIKLKGKILTGCMLERKRKSKYENFVPENLPPTPPKPEDLDYDNVKESGGKSKDYEQEPAEERSGSSPPLFIKLDRYKELAKQIKRLKSISMGMRDALDALNEIEREIANGVVIANRSLEELSGIINELDLRFAKVKEAEEGRIPRDAEEYVKKGYARTANAKTHMEEF